MDRLSKIDYRAFVLWGMLLVLPFYLVANELAKGVLVISGTVALLSVLFSPLLSLKSLSRTELLFCFSFLFFPLCFAFSYLTFGAPHDYEFFIEFFRMSILAIALFMCLKRANDLDFEVFKISVSALGILSGLVGGCFLIRDGGRITVGTDLINMYGAIMACAAGLAFHYLFQEQRFRLMVVYYLAGFFSLSGVLASGSKIAIIAVAFVLICSMVIGGRSRKRLLLAVLLPAIIIVLSIGPIKRFVMMASVITEETVRQQSESSIGANERVEKPRKVDGSIGVRVQMYKAAIEAIVKKPLLGHGTWRFKDLFPDELASGELLPQTRRFAHVHNELLQAWMTRGTAGLASFVLLLVAPILATRKASKEIKASVLIIVYTFFLVAMFEAPFNANVTYAFYILTLALILSFGGKRGSLVEGVS